MRTTNLIAAALVLVAVGAACGGTREVTQPSSFPSGPISFESASVSPATGVLPTTSPGAATGRLLNGAAEARLSGDLLGVRSFPSLAPPALYSPPPGGLAVVWQSAAGTETLSLTGSPVTGEQPTSSTLTLTLNVLNGDQPVLLSSSAGECTVTIAEATASTLRGSYVCDRLTTEIEGGAIIVDASGIFTASG